MGKLQGKVALIAGAASGIGCASAIRFAAEGAGVVVAALNSQGGEGVVSEIAANGGRAVYQRTDVTSEQEIKSLMERAVREYGPPRYHLQQRWPKRRGWPDRIRQRGRLGQNLRGSHQGGLLRHQAFRCTYARCRRWLDHIDRFGGRPLGQLLSLSRLQRG
jgi:NAD(P)-dependent dehydrogenase (short-subunit alcohol dehydrogenase family)